jgi:CheY-like chemotaxis protein
LIADDTVVNLLAFSPVLKKLGCRIVIAGSGPEALRCTQQEDFRVVLLDVRMCEWNGVETAQQLRKRDRTRHTPIIFMSAFEVPTTHLLAEFVGSEDDFILSPVDTELLIRKVTPHLRNSSSEEPQDPSDPGLEKASSKSEQEFPDQGGAPPRQSRPEEL